MISKKKPNFTQNFKTMENQEIILKAMKDANKPVKAGEIAEVTGIDAKIVTKELGKMKKEGKVISPKVCFYSPA